MIQLRTAIAEERAQAALTTPRIPSAAPHLEFLYHVRWALSFTPLVLALFAVVVATRITRSRVVRWLVASAVVVGYWSVYFAIGDGALGFDRTVPIVIAWTPNLALLVVTGAIAKLARPGVPIAVA
jgi:lipopolysaccharide export LptBFGC system permease protein LptF